MWDRIKRIVVAEAHHVTTQFIADPDGEVLYPDQGYLRPWLVEGFLSDARTWGNDHFPALHGNVALSFGGSTSTTFSTFTRTSDIVKIPGERVNYPVSPLLPYTGGVVEIEAALYQATKLGPLAVAVQLAGAIAPLIGPPLSVAAAVADHISGGIDAVLGSVGNKPILAVHQGWSSAGGGGAELRSGTLVVANTPPGSIEPFTVIGGVVHIDSKPVAVRPEGIDYLVIRLECREKRDNWRLPQFDALIRSAGEAYLRGHLDTFAAQRTEAIAAAWTSLDLVGPDRIRVAKLVAAEIDKVKELGAVPSPDRTFDVAATESLLPRDAPELANVTLADLIA
jgi:hypothetical protein